MNGPALFNPLLSRPNRFAAGYCDGTPGFGLQNTAYIPAVLPVTSAIALAPLSPSRQLEAEKLKEEGNKLIQVQLWDQALKRYQQAVTLQPDYTDAWFNMHTALNHLGRMPEAVTALRSLLHFRPNDHEARSLLAQHLRDMDQPQSALTEYQTILKQAPQFDPARRGAAYVQNRLWANAHPQQAQEAFAQAAVDTLAQAQGLLEHYYIQCGQTDRVALLKQLPVVFETTQTRVNTSNVGEYDAERGRIRLTPEMAYAHPAVVAANLAHELEHAADGDGLTSLWEEEDGYRAMVQFWQGHRQLQNGDLLLDPNLDTSLRLYQQSPGTLYRAVDQTYQRVDPTMPQRSPGHGLPPNLGQDPLLWQQYLAQRGGEILDRYRNLVQEQVKSLLP